MSQLAIGIIETIGLAAAIEAADVCVKSANVNLIGYELTKGNGMTVVKIEGNVGAVKAAIEAAAKVSRVYSKKIIPRPSDSIEFLIKNENTVGYKVDEKEKIIDKDINTLEEIYIDDISDKTVDILDDTNKNMNDTDLDDNEDELEEDQSDSEELDCIEETENEEEQDEKTKENANIDEDESNKGYTCNLCKDPKCSRQKGDLKIDCIHYDEKKDN